MASLRNAMKRRTHKERHQPAKRAKRFGLLEKHKDYVQRARNYRQKRGRLRVLREKADARNPDEFYFGMVNAQTRDGLHDGGTTASAEGGALSAATLRLMQTQDASYVRMKAGVERRKIEKLSAGLHFLHQQQPSSSSSSSSLHGASHSKPKHTIFVDSKEEVDNFDAAAYFDTLPEFVGRTFNRPRRAALLGGDAEEGEGADDDWEESGLDDDGNNVFTSDDESSEEEDGKDGGKESAEAAERRRLRKARKARLERRKRKEEAAKAEFVVHGAVSGKSMRRMRKKRDRAYQELGERIQREAALQTVAQRMDLKRHLAGKGRRVKLNAPAGGAEGGRRFYRWKKERKR